MGKLIDAFREKKRKDANRIVLIRIGDFYETYCEDALVLHDVLGLTLTMAGGNGYPITGFPVHALDTYLPKIVRSGHSVCLTDQESIMDFRDKDGNIVCTKKETKQNNNSNHETTMNNNFLFKSVKRANRYMFYPEMQALVEVKPVRAVYNLNNGKCSQEWRVANTDKVVKTCYTPATEEQPRQFDGKIYKSREDFERDAPMPVSEVFGDGDISEGRVCERLIKNGRRYVKTDDKGAYIWAFCNGEAAKWYFRDHIDEVVCGYGENEKTTVTSDCDCEIPEAYRDAEDVYLYNDYRFIDENGKETVKEGVLKRLFLEPDQKELADKLQAVLNECKEAGMCVYWSNADYTLNAVNTRKIDRIEYSPSVDEETERPYYFDDSRCAHTFSGVTDLNSENDDLEFVIKK